MMKYEIDDDFVANLEVKGNPCELTADICTLMAAVMAEFDSENKKAFISAIIGFLSDESLHKLEEDK